MAIFSKRTILFFTIIITVLQIIHMILLSQLDAKKNEKNLSKTSIFDSPNDTDGHLMFETIKQNSFLDSSGQMLIVHNIIKGISFQNVNFNDITLVTQSSLSSFYHLSLLAKHWKGYISIALFSLISTLNLTIEAILFFKKCFPTSFSNITFHLVFPSFNSSPILTQSFWLPNFKSFSSYNCDQFAFAIKSQTLNLNYDYKDFEYPINLLRNVASSNILTKFKLVIDIDLVPSANLRENFLKFMDDDKQMNQSFSQTFQIEKSIYILPVFEIKNEESEINIPIKKTSLLNMIETGSCRPFYFELCWKCQKYTNYKKWESEPLEKDFKVSFEVEWHDPWEPFYISQANVPNYDERFRQYGFNRISQVCELYVAGYKFLVLNSAFLIHKGFKTKNSFHIKKKFDLEKNRKIFRKFKSELKLKYPNSSRRC